MKISYYLLWIAVFLMVVPILSHSESEISPDFVRTETKRPEERQPAFKKGKNTNKKTTLKYKTTKKYDKLSFDVSTNILRVNYNGHNPVDIYNNIKILSDSTKSEFETTEQFSKRIELEQNKPLFGNMKRDDFFALSIDPDSKYDADSRTIKLYVHNQGTYNGFNKSITDNVGFILTKISSKKTSYIAANAFGATTKVNALNEELLLLSLTNNRDDFVWSKDNEHYDGGYSFRYIEFKIDNVDIVSAKKLKNNIKLLFVTKLQRPYTSQGTYYSGPTYDSPTSVTQQYNNISAVVLEIWCYNYKTGEIIKKIKIPVSKS